MNIALFSPNKNPYSETFIQAHKNGLKGKVFYFYGKSINIKLENNDDFNLNKSFSDQLKDKLLKRSGKTIWDYLFNALKLFQIDIILIEYGTHANSLLPFLKKTSIPVVVHFHGYDASMHEVLKRVNNYKELFGRADKIITVSTVMSNKLIDLGCSMDKIILNPCGPREMFLESMAQFTKEQFISVGRFTDKKAPYYTILAFSKVLNIFPNSNLVMAGDGDLLNVSRNIVKYLGIEDKVTFPGVIDSFTLINYLKDSIAYVQHSIESDAGDMEGTPVSVLEACAAGVPVISTIHGGISDVVLNGITGLLCEEHDVDQMANNMIYLLENKEIAQIMGTKGKKRVLDNFTMKHHLGILDKVFNELNN